MNVYLFLRKTEDWKNVPLEECCFIESAKKYPHFHVLKDWNEKLAMTWQAFRFELQQKAFESWGDIPILSAKWQIDSKNDEDVIIPIDDDDWLHPDIVSFIKAEMKDNACLQWTQAVNSYYPNRRHIYKWGQTNYQRDVLYSTSDHALRIGVLKTFDKKTLLNTLHGHPSVWKRFMYTRRMYVPETMSCYNHHIGSHSFLTKTKSLDELLERVGFINDIPDWASDYTDRIHWLDKLTSLCAENKSSKHLKHL